jgi:probable rRNA maturation factor
MILFNSEIDFNLSNEDKYIDWISSSIENECLSVGEINYIFCDDEYLHKINVDYLNHDTLTDIISFDYTQGDVVSGDIFISIDRVKDNAHDFNVTFDNELLRVMIHGVMHYCGYKDKTIDDVSLMRSKEDFYIAKF